ncbi:MAG: universal stress protein [Candidatus Thorarchaeota archaeon]
MEDPLYHESGRLLSRTKRVMLPIDGSEGSARAAIVAFEIAELTKSKLYIVHVINTGVVQQVARMSDKDSEDILRTYEENGEKLLERCKAAALGHGLEVETMLEQGLPSDRITALAASIDVDIIVMGSKGLSSSRKPGLGSSTERVIRRINCAVLVVHVD